MKGPVKRGGATAVEARGQVRGVSGWWELPRVNGACQILVCVSGESPSISRQIRAPAVSRSAPSATQRELIARGQRSRTASRPDSSIRPSSGPRGRWASR